MKLLADFELDSVSDRDTQLELPGRAYANVTGRWLRRHGPLLWSMIPVSETGLCH